MNTELWETRPTVAGRWLLFGRIDARTRVDRVVLHDLQTGSERILDQPPGHRPAIEPGQVVGRYAVWASGINGAYRVYRYDIATQRKDWLAGPDPYRQPQFAPSVTADGTVYYGRSGLGCGSDVLLVAAPLRGRARIVARLPRGFDLRTTYAVRLRAGGVRLLYDRFSCRMETADLDEVRMGRG